MAGIAAEVGWIRPQSPGDITIPEPGTLTFIGLGLAVGLGYRYWRKRRNV
jgi:LPXTG-motif cell wall-anchored protein